MARARQLAVLLALATALGLAAAQPTTTTGRHSGHRSANTQPRNQQHHQRSVTPSRADRPGDLDTLVRHYRLPLKLGGGGQCVDEWNRDPQNKAFQELSLHYGEKEVNNHAQTCDSSDNQLCIKSRDYGCALWAATSLCSPKPKVRTCKSGYVYLGNNSNDANHVILVPTVPIRGLEDIVDPATSAKAIALTEPMWGTFWDESVLRKTGNDDKWGFESPETGALDINPPFYREFHQMHIHSGKRIPAFDACIAHMGPPQKTDVWSRYHCTGLTGFSRQSDAIFVYTTVPDLGSIWRVYLAGLSQALTHNALVAAGYTPAQAKTNGGYHVGMLVTSPPAWRAKNEFLVILYAPSPLAKQNPDVGKLGRGQFITNNRH